MYSPVYLLIPEIINTKPDTFNDIHIDRTMQITV